MSHQAPPQDSREEINFALSVLVGGHGEEVGLVLRNEEEAKKSNSWNGQKLKTNWTLMSLTLKMVEVSTRCEVLKQTF